MMSPVLKKRLLTLIASGASAIAIAAALVRPSEGLRHYAYQDVGGVWTVCYGHTGPDVVLHRYYSDGECETLLNRDLATADAAVQRYVKVPMTRPQHAALIDFTLNMGAGNLATSTLLRKFNAGQTDAACQQYRRWVYAAGKKLKGLENRREAEKWLCSMS